MSHPGCRSPGSIALRLAIVTMSVWCGLGTSVDAQDPPVGVSLVGRFEEAGSSYADVWAEGDVVYLARSGQRFVDIVDISNPAKPMKLSAYDSAQTASAQDVKAAGGLLFIGLEGGAPGCQIVDVRDPQNPLKLTDVDVRDNVHNVFFDRGWLYLVDSALPAVDIVDLRAYDPDAAPAVIDTVAWTVSNVGTDRVHDVTVQDGRLYASAWDSGIWVYDVSALATAAPSFLGSAPGNNVHSSWATDDGAFLVVAEERSGGGLTLYEVTEGAGTVTLTARDTLVLDPARANSVHNPVLVGDRIYSSWYQAGILAVDIDRAAGTLAEVASYDTTATGSGCWGVYPFLGADRILGSDIGNGLFVLDFTQGAIFADGFESGDLSAWSAAVGGP